MTKVVGTRYAQSMTKDKSKQKKKKKPTALSKEDFAFLCQLIMQGSDNELDNLWEESAQWYTGDDREDVWVNDFVVEEEVALFARVNDIMQKVALRFGYAKPLYPDDLLAEPAPTPSVKAPPADPKPAPELVLGRAT